MIRTYVQLPRPVYYQLKSLAQTQDLSFTEATRQVLRKGLELDQNGKKNAGSILLELAELGEKYHIKGPKDWSSNLDKYTWDE